MPKNPTLLDYLNSFNYICIEDAGEFYNIKMHSIISKEEGIKFKKLDGTSTDEATYWVLVPKRSKITWY